jgi:hypothetical protein
MNGVAVTSGSRSGWWRRSFADALIRMQPELNPDAADELSDVAYLRMADLDPERAASLYALKSGLPTGAGEVPLARPPAELAP